MLRQIREDKGLTQARLAQLSKVDQGYISALESGQKKNPGLDVLKKLAKALDVDLSKLVEG